MFSHECMNSGNDQTGTAEKPRSSAMSSEEEGGLAKATRTVVIVAVVTGLMLSIVGSVSAAEPSPIPVPTSFGAVAEKGETSDSERFVKLETVRGLVKVQVTTETKYKGMVREEVTFEDIETSARIKVAATKANGDVVARSVTLLPQFIRKPQLLKKAWIELAPERVKKVRLDMPPQQIKRLLIHLPPQLTKPAPLNVPPQIVKI